MGNKNTKEKHTKEIATLLQKYSELLNNDSIEEDLTTFSNAHTVKKKVSFINKQYTHNEKQKRTHRTVILIIVSILIFIQLIFFNVIVAIMLASITMDLSIFNNVSNEIAKLLLDFLKFYISATIVELLGMFLFIIRNVFDWSIKDLYPRKP